MSRLYWAPDGESSFGGAEGHDWWLKKDELEVVGWTYRVAPGVWRAYDGQTIEMFEYLRDAADFVLRGQP